METRNLLLSLVWVLIHIIFYDLIQMMREIPFWLTPELSDSELDYLSPKKCGDWPWIQRICEMFGQEIKRRFVLCVPHVPGDWRMRWLKQEAPRWRENHLRLFSGILSVLQPLTHSPLFPTLLCAQCWLTPRTKSLRLPCQLASRSI